jgi:hypothetical protein
MRSCLASMTPQHSRCCRSMCLNSSCGTSSSYSSGQRDATSAFCRALASASASSLERSSCSRGIGGRGAVRLGRLGRWAHQSSQEAEGGGAGAQQQHGDSSVPSTAAVPAAPAGRPAGWPADLLGRLLRPPVMLLSLVRADLDAGHLPVRVVPAAGCEGGSGRVPERACIERAGGQAEDPGTTLMIAPRLHPRTSSWLGSCGSQRSASWRSSVPPPHGAAPCLRHGGRREVRESSLSCGFYCDVILAPGASL